MDYRFTIYSLVFLAAGLLSFFVAYISWQGRKVKAAEELAIVMFSAGIWALFVILETASGTIEGKIFWSKIAYLPAVFTPVAYLFFVISFINREKWLNIQKKIWISFIPAITFLLALTNDFHHLIWTGFSPISPVTNLAEYFHGIGFWIGYLGYNYILLFTASFFLVRHIFRQIEILKLQGGIIFLASICPWIASVLYLTNNNPAPGFDIVPFSIIMSGTLIAWSIFNKRFLEIAPVARETLVEVLEEGIVVLDEENRIQDINSSARKFLEITRKDVLGLSLKAAAGEDKLANAVLSKNTQASVEIIKCEGATNKSTFTYVVNKQEITNHAGSRLIIIRDETMKVKRQRLLDAIARANSILVQGENLDESIEEALGIIGIATETNRAYIFTNTDHPGYKMPLMSQKYEWTDGTTEKQIDNQYLQNLPYENVCPRWFTTFLSGGTITGIVSEFPDMEKADLESQGIKSILATPIFVDKKLWGFIGFDDCMNEREWSVVEEILLSAAANTIGAAYLRKLNQEELIVAKERAEESDRLKSAFLSNLSHEIRTPLNAITGFLDLFQTTEISAEEQILYSDLLKKSSERILSTLNDIIEISKIEAGHTRLSEGSISLNETIDILCATFKTEAEGKGLRISAIKGLVDRAAFVNIDKVKLEAILINLIKNAIKFTQVGFVEFGYMLDHDRLIFFVRDSGIGIPLDRQEVIFDAFMQVDQNITRSYEGTGIGLAIVKEYVEMLGGSIGVESEPGKGSYFYFGIKYNPI
ncbi:MAG: histidine kinase N-terminal 7TM domain-containing protein [Bacteroidales bacterium]|jgi:signal transduction histidine kinase/PAS domain-containing protein